MVYQWQPKACSLFKVQHCWLCYTKILALEETLKWSGSAIWFYKWGKLRPSAVMLTCAVFWLSPQPVLVGHMLPFKHGCRQEYTDGWAQGHRQHLGSLVLCLGTCHEGTLVAFPAHVFHSTSILMWLGLMLLATQAWNKQEKWGALNFQLITDLLK